MAEYSDKPQQPPLPPAASMLPALPPAASAPTPELRPLPPADDKIQLERKLAELERRLAVEREKLLVANVKREAEAANAAKVEVSIKELQDKLRRDRRDQEQQEARLKLESKLQEMEQRLAQERETWVVTLRNQLQARETQDKELESHFALRVQEMERRWLEEKAQWQKVMLGKDEEIRNLRNLAEKLKGADIELQKTVSEKRWLETRMQEMMQERAEVSARLSAATEREKENIQLRGELQLSRQQVGVAQEKLERELHSLRLSAKEREERLLADQERLQRELASAGERARSDSEAELRRAKADQEAQLARYKESVERAAADLQKLRGAAGALERQWAASRAQVSELQAARASWERTQERFKAEFIVLQRKWAEREKEIRAESDARAQQMLEAEKAKIKVLAQEEINHRVARAAEQLQKERESDVKRVEATMRVELEQTSAERSRALQADWDRARKELEGEIERLHLDLEKEHRSAESSAKERETLLARQQELERLCTAQAAQVQNLQGLLDQARGELARELHLARLHLQKEQSQQLPKELP